jgi:hypothetical protein
MLTARFLVASAVLGLGATAALSQPAPPPPTGGPAFVTTDTPEYCEKLAERVARAEHVRPDPPRAVEELAEEGHRMCASGLIRGGLVRLRRALLMLRTER